MFLMGVGGWIGLGIAVLFLVLIIVCVSWIIRCYNTLSQLRNKVKNAFSQIDGQIKRRFDLIPNLVETVKGYAKLEEGIWEEFGKARGLYQSASKNQDVEGMAKANESLGGVVSRLMVVTEQYPTLKADVQFIALQDELKNTEKQVAYARQFYNDIVQKYNNKVEMFPGNIVAGMFHFELAKFFEIVKEEQREAPQVKF